ncbi:MAG: ATP-binding protein [Verrucomicrobiota bacterium]
MLNVLIILAALLAAAAVAIHFAWQSRFRRAQAEARAELDRLRESLAGSHLEIEARQEAVLDSMIEGLLLLDAEGRIRLANRAFASLFNIAGDVRGRTLVEALRSHELAELAQSVTPDHQVLGHELRMAGLPERWIQINAATVSRGPGKPGNGTILVFHDLTRIKQLERTRQEFVANVSHELRTPLSLIKGYVETLLDGAKDNPEVATRFLQTIQRNAARLQFLIEDLLTISELEGGRIQMNLQRVELPAAAEKVFAELGPRAAARKVTLSHQVQNLAVQADPDRLQQMLANLVDNAIKYGRAEGCVEITARSDDAGMVELCVADDGPGIPAASLERVFERFYRVDKARSREQGGTGLGLSIVKHLVQNHGGRVWAKSEPGQGAAFYLSLPAAKAAPDSPEATKS